MKIDNFEIYSAKAALDKPIADATHTLTEISFLVVRIYTVEGTMGEAYLLSFQYSPAAILGALKDQGPHLLGEQICDTGKVTAKLNAGNEYFGEEGINRWAQSAYNIAMWDAWGKKLQQPVWRILGNHAKKISGYGSGGWISYSREELSDEVKSYAARGFHAVKIKVGKPDWREDLERLHWVREAVGTQINIMMDANQGMRTANALALARAARDIGIQWFEEPIHHHDYEGYALLRNQAGISIAMGEREYNTVPLRELAQRNAIDIWQPDILRIGGVEAWRESAALANAFHIPVLPHYYKDYDVPLLMTIPNGAGTESFDWIDPLIDAPIRFENGYAIPNNRPGWGFQFNDQHLTLLYTWK